MGCALPGLLLALPGVQGCGAGAAAPPRSGLAPRSRECWPGSISRFLLHWQPRLPHGQLWSAQESSWAPAAEQGQTLPPSIPSEQLGHLGEHRQTFDFLILALLLIAVVPYFAIQQCFLIPVAEVACALLTPFPAWISVP